MKTIKIACTGADMCSIDDFKPLQGDLKFLSDEDYQRLKKLILDFGFSDPINVWDRDNTKFIISGHQRVATLKRMRDEGYTIPFVPYNLVDAESEHEAKMKVLGAASQFGKITPRGLRAFMEELDLEISDLDHDFALPNVDLPALAAVDLGSPGVEVDVTGHTRTIGAFEPGSEADQGKLDEKTPQIIGCPHCGAHFDKSEAVKIKT